MAYQHHYIDDQECNLPTGKVVCVGRNYADHAKELNNPIPTEPLIFIKPATSVVTLEDPFTIPLNRGSVHFETEMSILIGKSVTCADEREAEEAIVGVGLGLDLTLRDLQSRLKEKGQPWEKAKAFDGSCPLSAFAPAHLISDLQNVTIRMSVNGEQRQLGNSNLMLNRVIPLICHISEFFTLEAGDVILTGTPAGVGEINVGDQVEVWLDDLLHFNTSVTES